MTLPPTRDPEQERIVVLTRRAAFFQGAVWALSRHVQGPLTMELDEAVRQAERNWPLPVPPKRRRVHKGKTMPHILYRVVDGQLEAKNLGDEWHPCTAIWVNDREGINDLFARPFLEDGE